MDARAIIAAARRGFGQLVRRPVLIVVLAAAAVRAWTVMHVPLVVTNDSVGYAQWASSILQGDFPDLPIFRTPGYPIFLAGLWAAAGVGPQVVLFAQHALGVATCTLVAATAGRFGGPRAALACGLLAALDLRLLGLECYLLTESLATFLAKTLGASP